MDNREAFEAVINNPPFELDVSQYPKNDSSAWPGDYRVYDVSLAWKIWQAAIAHIKQNYTLCEKEPDSHKDVHINGKWKTVPLYRESQS
jgi:hypothetical protein